MGRDRETSVYTTQEFEAYAKPVNKFKLPSSMTTAWFNLAFMSKQSVTRLGVSQHKLEDLAISGGSVTSNKSSERPSVL